MEADKNYIFISYSRKDSSKVIPIVEEMQNSGYNVWYDKKIPVGKNWLNSLASHIKRCTVCVAFHSQTSRDSKYCQREIHYALKKDKPVFSVYLEDVTLEDGLDMQLSPFQSVRYTNPAKVLEELRTNQEFECCHSDAPRKRKGVNVKKIGTALKKSVQFLFRAVSLLVALALLVAILVAFVFYKKQTPIGLFLDKSGVLDIIPPFSKVKMPDYNYDPNNFYPPPWAGKTQFTQCAVIRKGVTRIGDSSFENCSNMKSVFISEGVTSIGARAFSGCTALNEINFPSSLEVLSEKAFFGCTGLENFYMPRTVEIRKISSYVFSGCIGLKEIYIPYGVTDIGHNAFSDCIGLESVSFASSVTNIEPYAFSGCTSLKQIEFIKGFSIGIQEIGSYAFSGCSNLKIVHIQGYRDVKMVEDENWDSISDSDSGTLYIATTAFDPDTEIILGLSPLNTDVSDSD